jgi:hypothetical protein
MPGPKPLRLGDGPDHGSNVYFGLRFLRVRYATGWSILPCLRRVLVRAIMHLDEK